ncbi:AraC family transcriptional regulator [Desulfovibrio sp. OttesenSCG-928-G15]|nr:AraC family transcriptional regulator [Desulfovibrio sp. OttesenSCG-928-G15]
MTDTNRIDFEKCRIALRDTLLQRMPYSGNFTTPVSGMVLHRYHSNDAPAPRFYDPVIIIIAQGKKWVRIGTKDIPYGEHSCFIAGVNMPVSSCVLEAAEDKPYLSISLSLDKGLIASLAAKIPPAVEPYPATPAGAAVQATGPELLDAFLRLLELTDNPEQAQVLGPLIYQEIHYRLLVSPFGYHLRQLNTFGSQGNQINQAIAWLRSNFKESLYVEELASSLNMATSTFHKYFKEITTLSPLQYQKRLRLSEAQRLMLADNYDVTRAAFAVGYESATQFNREYKRLFGESPRKDVTKMKEVAVQGTASASPGL